MSKVTIIFVGILLINFLVGEAFEYDDVPEYYESPSEAAESEYATDYMQGEGRQIILNPQRRRERRKKRIGKYQHKSAIKSKSGLSQVNEILFQPH